MGVTAHWIDPKSLERKSCVLACCPFRDEHTFDRIAEQLACIKEDFRIEGKLAVTVTDNRSSFVKAFRELGMETPCDSDTSGDEEDSASGLGSVECAEIPDVVEDGNNGAIVTTSFHCSAYALRQPHIEPGGLDRRRENAKRPMLHYNEKRHRKILLHLEQFR